MSSCTVVVVNQNDEAAGPKLSNFCQGKGKAVGCGALDSSLHGICVKDRSLKPSRSPGDEKLWLLAGELPVLCCCAGALWSCYLLISASASKASQAGASSTSQPPSRAAFQGRTLSSNPGQVPRAKACCHQLCVIGWCHLAQDGWASSGLGFPAERGSI